MRILVLGGAGFVGANLVRRCVEDTSNHVTVLDSLDQRLKSSSDNLAAVWDRIRFVRGRLSDEALLADLVQGQDVIFHLAAQTSHLVSLTDPLLDAESNCLGALRVLEAARLLNRRAVIVYPSTSSVIGKSTAPVIDESHPEKPLDIYSANKSVAEKYFSIYHTVHDLRTVVLRFSNLFGPFGKPYPDFGFLNCFISLAMQGKQIEIFGSGEQLRNVMYVGDAADLLYRAAQDDRLVGETLFATGDDHLSVIEIARRIVAVFQSGGISHIDWPEQRRRIEVERVQIDSSKLRGLIGWRPRFTFDEGLAQTKAVLSEQAQR